MKTIKTYYHEIIKNNRTTFFNILCIAISITFFLIIEITPAFSLEECQDVVSIEEIPCKVTTKWAYPDPCNTYIVDLYFDNVTFLYSQSLSESGIYCYWEFNETNAGDYYFNVSSGDAGHIKEANKMYNLLVYGGYLLIMLILIVIIHSFQKDKEAVFIYGLIGGIISFIMTGILLSGFKVFSNITFIIDVNYYITALTLVIGLYVSLVGFIFFKEVRDKQKLEAERIERGY